MANVQETPGGEKTSALAADYKAPTGVGNNIARRRPTSRQPLQFEAGRKIGNFELIREIARGGMGQVFLARDTKLGRKVAIKFLLHDDPSLTSRFIVEARATARCEHENIVRIYAADHHENLPYMVLEFLEGKTFTQILETKQTLRAIVELMIPVVRALERAHEHGIVHRDLKPSNIFVTERGVVKVLDFGVAKWFESGPAEGDFPEHNSVAGTNPGGVPAALPPGLSGRAGSELTGATATVSGTNPTGIDAYVTFSANGALVGTLPYMSPEQWGAGDVDHTSDIWAVGIMFWRALLSVHPAGSMVPEKLRTRLLDMRNELPSIGMRDPSLPKPLVRIIDKCLAKRKANRYQSATELLADMVAFASPNAERDEDQCPYRGLAAFGENDAKFFFGRTAEIRTAVGQLEAWPLLAVVGPSGVGKSSFLHAGVVPAVRNTGGGNWEVRVVRPGRMPLAALAVLLADMYSDPSRTLDAPALMQDAPGHFGVELRTWAQQNRRHVLLVVDQLEELFTLCNNASEQQTFLAALLAAADDPSAPVRVVMSMRADFLDRLAGHKYFLAELSRGLFFLSAPDADNLRDAIIRPAELAGYAFEDTNIPDEMLKSVARSRGALPLLQFAAAKLWDTRDRDRKMLTRASFEAMGGVGGAFSRHADEVVASIPPTSLPMLRGILSRLVTPEGTRAVVDKRELVTLGQDQDEITRIIDNLIRARLITSQIDATSGAAVETVEIVHEALISEWPTLRQWLDDNQSLRGFLHELRHASKQWDTKSRDVGLLWTGHTAREALANDERHVLNLSQIEREFLQAVRLHLQRDRRFKMALGIGGATGLAVILIGGLLFSVQVSREATRARLAETKIAEQLESVQKAKTLAEDALERQRQAEHARAATEKAKAATDIKLDATQQDLRQAYEAVKKEAAAAEKSAQVAKANEELAKKSAATAKVAQKEAEDAKKVTERLLAQANAEKARLQKELSKIANDPLK